MGQVKQQILRKAGSRCQAPAFLFTGCCGLASRRHCAEAIVAVDRSVTPRLEGDLGIFAALPADSREHLPPLAVTAAASVTAVATRGVGLARGTAFGATLRLIGVATGLELFLLFRREHEVCTTVGAGKGFVVKTQ